MLANECVRRSEAEVRAGLLKIWSVMTECVHHGCSTAGVLPGGLKVRRRAADLYQRLVSSENGDQNDPLVAMDWVTLWALAVNEENASGGRVVTAPTNGAAGIIPAVLHYAVTFVPGHRRRRDRATSCSWPERSVRSTSRRRRSPAPRSAARARSEQRALWRRARSPRSSVARRSRWRTPQRSAWNTTSGLTCDPVGGLVQIPCIERNAVGSVKAITAARLALHGDGRHTVSLDKVIKTMMETGADMKIKYKETARGGLAVNIVEC